MNSIVRVRSILLSAPYGDPVFSAENRLHLPTGYRTCGLVEVTLSDGIVGLGEAYLAVFAPHVFTSIVDLLGPLVMGRDVADVQEVVRDLVAATGYWSLQGAARHVVGAIEIALLDCAARTQDTPLWAHLGARARPLRAYASGGDSLTPDAMRGELEQVSSLGIGTFKIRGRSTQVDKVVWTARRAADRGIEIAVDMTQNLVVPSQSSDDVLAFVARVAERSGQHPVFLEEVLGPDRIHELATLRAESPVPIAGGETVTTAAELIDRVSAQAYDIVQPDATVIGGIGSVLEVFGAANTAGTQVYVHCWGGAVGVAANFHAAMAGGGSTVEWPLPSFPLRSELLDGVMHVDDGAVLLSERPGLGIVITPEFERAFAFRPDAVYDCLGVARIPRPDPWGDEE